MADLSPKQEAVRTFIADELAAGRPCPSHREIAKHFGFASLNAASCHVQALIKKGALIAETGKARTLRLSKNTKPFHHRRVAEIPLFGAVPAGFADARKQEAKGCVSIDI